MTTDYKKVTQALNWLAKMEGAERMNKMKAIKLIWMADRLHLREHGRPITNDDYVAMQFGPVGSLTRNIMEEATPYLTDEQYGYSSQYLASSNEDKFFYQSVNDLDMSVFSASEVDVLNRVYKDFGQFDQFELRDLTHEFPEWKKYEDGLNSRVINQAPMNYRDFFKNPNPESKLINDKFVAATRLFGQSGEQLEALEQAFAEMQDLHELWT